MCQEKNVFMQDTVLSNIELYHVSLTCWRFLNQDKWNELF